MDITQATSFCVSAAAISAAAVLVLERFARSLGLIDVPGGRKAHAREVPLVGGLAIFISLLTSAWCFGFAREVPYFLLALSLLIAVGLWDDVADIRPRIKFGVQVVAAAVMIWGAGIQLHTVGDLIGWRPIGLSFLASRSSRWSASSTPST